MRLLVRLSREASLTVEANDMACFGIGEGGALVAGPHINTYNAETVQFLAEVGVRRVVLPVELPMSFMADIMRTPRPGGMQMEVFSYGRLPLSFSARCYTARAFNLPKSNCQFKCADFPDGMRVSTQDGQGFLNMNGVQTMSDPLFNLVDRMVQLRQIGTDVVRISPQSRHMVEIVSIWRQRLEGQLDDSEAFARLQELNGNDAFCNGYFLGKPGMAFIAQNQDAEVNMDRVENNDAD